MVSVELADAHKSLNEKQDHGTDELECSLLQSVMTNEIHSYEHVLLLGCEY